MPDSRYLLGVVCGAVAVLVVGGVATELLSGTESTTELDRFSSATVDGHKVLLPNIVAGRTESKYHPLPWVGTHVRVSCPTGLRAVDGAVVHCTGKRNDGTTVGIRVVAIKATASHLTWKFER